MAKEYIAISVRNGGVYTIQPSNATTGAVLDKSVRVAKSIGEIVAALAGHQYELLNGNGIIALGDGDAARLNCIVFMHRDSIDDK